MPRKKSGVTTTRPIRGPTVALRLPDTPHELYTHCTASWAGMKADTVHFPTPPLTAAQIEGHLSGLAAALVANEDGGPATTIAVETAANKVRGDFQQLRPYVQIVLRAGSIEDVPGILANVLMYQSNVGKRSPKEPFAVAHGTLGSGSVHLTALAVLQALTYEWQWSADQVTWSVTKTGHSYADLTGLTPGKLYYFRFTVFRRDGTTTAESATLSLIVI